jgi:hypothetical protein
LEAYSLAISTVIKIPGTGPMALGIHLISTIMRQTDISGGKKRIK